MGIPKFAPKHVKGVSVTETEDLVELYISRFH